MFFGKKREEELEAKLGELTSKIQSTTSELNSQLEYENNNAIEIKDGMVSLKEKNENVKRELSCANAVFLGVIDEMKDKSAAVDSNAKIVEKLKESISDKDAFDTTKITRSAEKLQEELRVNDRNVGFILEEIRSIEVISATLKDISNQTSALSLNAAIIGAKIDSGNEGFVQTATEIKELAQSCSKAVGDLNRKIERITSLIETITSENSEMKDVASEGSAAAGEFAKAYDVIYKEFAPKPWSEPEKKVSFENNIKDIENLKQTINDIWTMQDEGVNDLEELIKKAEAQVELGTQAREIASELN